MIARPQVVNAFVAAGAPVEAFSGMYPRFSLADATFETCSPEFVQRSYEDCLDSLPPECVTTRDIGGGKTVRVMRHTMMAGGDSGNESGDCDDHGHVFMAHCIVGNWKKAIRTGTRRGGLALGVVDYIAIPKAEDRRQGCHDRNWFINHDLSLWWFEPAENRFVTMLPAEVASLTYGRAA